MKKVSIIILCLLTEIIVSAQNPYKLLVQAYKRDSIQLFDQFLSEWEQKSVPQKQTSELTSIEKFAYEIYEDFYNPFKLSKYGRPEWGDSLYTSNKCVIIQNGIEIRTVNSDSVNFYIFDNIDSLIIQRTILSNFRPNLKFENIKVLFLTREYDKILNKFLKQKHFNLGHGGIMNPARARGTSADKQEFINKRFFILYGHWGGYWHLETHPEIQRITFNRDFTIAKIDYRLGYQGGEAIYLYTNGGWTFNYAHLTWIE